MSHHDRARTCHSHSADDLLGDIRPTAKRKILGASSRRARYTSRKAVEGHRSPRRFATAKIIAPLASVLGCAGFRRFCSAECELDFKRKTSLLSEPASSP